MRIVELPEIKKALKDLDVAVQDIQIASAVARAVGVGALEA